MLMNPLKINEVQSLNTNAFKFVFGKYQNNIFNDINSNIQFLGSGRAALRLILEYYQKKGKILNKNNQILVPHWLCSSVLCSMNKFCSPSLTYNKGIKGVFVYHQYGYPQKMDVICDYCEEKNLFLIEDCAHAFESYYSGKRLGTFGDASIFSFPKFFPSVLGGALITDNDELYHYSKTRIQNCNKTISLLTYGSRFLWECFTDTAFSRQVQLLQEMMYGIIDSSLNIRKISLRVINSQLLNGAIEQRKKNYKLLLEYFDNSHDYFYGLERDGVVPYVVPLFDDEKKLKIIIERLKQINFITGIYNFDVNRNLLDPSFKKCIWIPIHQGINHEHMNIICETIKKID